MNDKEWDMIKIFRDSLYGSNPCSEILLDWKEARGGQKKPPETKEIPDNTDDTLIIY